MLAECKKRGLGHVEKVERANVEDGINGTRRMLARMEFDEAETHDGVKCLKNYRKEWDEDLGVWKDKPRHDWASHGADALRGLALFFQELKPDPLPDAKPKWWHEQTAAEIFALDKFDDPKREWI
jgi:hypothetical protein